ncbi:MAG: dihydrodipicolinate synthase family protein, partial [Thermoleophilia bacterium]|nr:dihydrodipicolinate synthase family protein [Thermoleophilia bacterium]
RLQVSCGSDDQALDYFRWGVTSWIAGTANVFPREHVEVLEAVTSGQAERAARLMAGLLPWIQHMEAGSYNQKAKLGLVLQGIPAGNTRPPLLPLGTTAAAEYTQIFESARAL